MPLEQLILVLIVLFTNRLRAVVQYHRFVQRKKKAPYCQRTVKTLTLHCHIPYVCGCVYQILCVYM